MALPFAPAAAGLNVSTVLTAFEGHQAIPSVFSRVSPDPMISGWIIQSWFPSLLTGIRFPGLKP